MINQRADLVGMLQLLWHDAWWGTAQPLLEKYRKVSKSLSVGTSISSAEVGRYLHYLNPTLYQHFASALFGEYISVFTAQAVLPVILNILKDMKAKSTIRKG